MFILRWVCWVLSLFPWPLWRKIYSSPYLHISALLTCCQHWANSNSSQSLSWLPARCPQQGGCFKTPFFVSVRAAGKQQPSIICHGMFSDPRKGDIVSVTPSCMLHVFTVLLWWYLLPYDTQIAACFPHSSKKLEIQWDYFVLFFILALSSWTVNCSITVIGCPTFTMNWFFFLVSY